MAAPPPATRVINQHLEEYDDPAKGRAIRAIGEIPCRTTILDNEQPLISVNTHQPWNDWDGNVGNCQENWWNLERVNAGAGGGRLQAEIAGAAAADVNSFRRLFHGVAPVVAVPGAARNLQDHDRLLKNSFASEDHDPILNRRGAWVRAWGDNISRLNHSCRPNALLATGVNGVARVVAVQKILAGADVELNYIRGNWLDTKTSRRNTLRRTWMFDCDCLGCNPATQADGIWMRTQMNGIINATQALPGGIGGVRALNPLPLTKCMISLTTRVHLCEALAGKDDNWIDAMLDRAAANEAIGEMNMAFECTREAMLEMISTYGEDGYRADELNLLWYRRERH